MDHNPSPSLGDPRVKLENIYRVVKSALGSGINPSAIEHVVEAALNNDEFSLPENIGFSSSYTKDIADDDDKSLAMLYQGKDDTGFMMFNPDPEPSPRRPTPRKIRANAKPTTKKRSAEDNSGHGKRKRSAEEDAGKDNTRRALFTVVVKPEDGN